MLRFGEREIAKETFYAVKQLKKIWDTNVDEIFITKLVEIKNNSEYLIAYSDKAIRPLVLRMPKMCGYINTFKA